MAEADAQAGSHLVECLRPVDLVLWVYFVGIKASGGWSGLAVEEFRHSVALVSGRGRLRRPWWEGF